MGKLKRDKTEMKLVVFLLGCAFGQKKIWGHTCQEVPLIKNFNLKKYAGTWYEAGRYSMSFQSDKGHCGIVHYGEVDETTISVNNSEIEPGKKNQMKRTYIIGDAVQPDASFPNQLTVKFDFNNKVANFFYNLFSGDEPNYFIMETDYKKYSLGSNGHIHYLLNNLSDELRPGLVFCQGLRLDYDSRSTVQPDCCLPRAQGTTGGDLRAANRRFHSKRCR